MNSLKFSIINIKKNFQNAKELKTTFLISVLGMMFNNFAFILLWFSFGLTVGSINGWGKYDIIGLYGFTMISYGLVFSIFYGIMNIPNYISTGNFDKFLLTPKNVLLKVSTSAISTSAIGDILMGIICYASFIILADLSVVQILASLVFIMLTSSIFFSFAVISMSISFYLMDGENISSGFFEMFLAPSLYHGGAFSGVLKIFFTFIIPSLLLGAIPVEVIKNLTFANFSALILFSLLWLVTSIMFFYRSLRKYESNNFFGFSG